MSANMAYGQVKLGAVESMRIPTSWLGLDEVGEEVEATMNRRDVQLPMNSLLVNQRLQCMPQQMMPLTAEKQFNVNSKFIQCLLHDNNTTTAFITELQYTIFQVHK